MDKKPDLENAQHLKEYKIVLENVKSDEFAKHYPYESKDRIESWQKRQEKVLTDLITKLS